MKTSTAERILRGVRRYGSRKAKVLVKRGGTLPVTFLVAKLRGWQYPLLEGADIGGMTFAASDMSCLAGATPEQVQAVLSNASTKVLLKH